MNNVLPVLCLALCSLPVVAQDNVAQGRFIFHPTKEFSKHWFVAAWVIGNTRQKTPDNINVFAGIGYRGKRWWVETMIQSQWSRTGGEVGVDCRLQVLLGKRASLYIEPAVYFHSPSFYEFVYLDYRAWGKLNLGVETENIHRVGPDVIALGPRISYPLWQNGRVRVALAGAWRFRPKEPNEIRLYTTVHIGL